MELVELVPLSDSTVGKPGIGGLSVEQRKRLTIAVELVANPSIVFMDEPTSGLDARAAAIVMRTVRNTVNTGRTVVCTIHQPSIDIFEVRRRLAAARCRFSWISPGMGVLCFRCATRTCALLNSLSWLRLSSCCVLSMTATADNSTAARVFKLTCPVCALPQSFDDLMLMKYGGSVIYHGNLGERSHRLIEYFKAVPGVPDLQEGLNPATWMLQVSTPGMESTLGVNFAEIYQNSNLFQVSHSLKHSDVCTMLSR